MLNEDNIPVVTIDGTSGSGKGTITAMVAQALNWHYLDSGVLYRALALSYINQNAHYIPDKLPYFLENFHISFVYESSSKSYRSLLNGIDIEDNIRDDHVGQLASKLAAEPEVRMALIECQRAFKHSPGLVADGRDMGTVIFPEAVVKIYLDASLEKRAQRRLKQLKEMGLNVTLSSLIEQMARRDTRDSSRKAAPLKPAEDAVIINTDNCTAQEVFGAVMKEIRHNINLGNQYE